MDPYAVVFNIVACLFAVGFAGNIADRLMAPFAKMVAPLNRIAASLAEIAKQNSFEDCGDPNCPACGGADDELDDDDFLEPDSGDDFHPRRKG